MPIDASIAVARMPRIGMLSEHQARKSETRHVFGVSRREKRDMLAGERNVVDMEDVSEFEESDEMKMKILKSSKQEI